MKNIRRIGLSVVLAGAFAISANATCDSAFCIGGNVGIGASYSDFGGDKTKDGNLTSGYGLLDLDLLFVKRLKLGLGFKTGFGSLNLSGSSLSSLPSSSAGMFGNIDLKLGFNVLNLEQPPYINFMSTASVATNKDFV